MRDVSTTKVAGVDRLSGRFLKDGADVPAKPVVYICNLSISLNKFPRAIKLAKVEPIYKKAKKLMTQITDPFPCYHYFRRFEKVVHEQTTKVLDGKIFYKYQSGSRSNHFTDLFVLFFIENFLKVFDNGMYTGMILIELQKAFDTINHKILALCLLFQHEEATEIKKKKQSTKGFSNICDWFVDNKLSLNFGEDKATSILFSSSHNLILVEELDIRYKYINIKQHKNVYYLRCVLDKTMSGETMAL